MVGRSVADPTNSKRGRPPKTSKIIHRHLPPDACKKWVSEAPYFFGLIPRNLRFEAG
jgi:hypothetical protein